MADFTWLADEEELSPAALTVRAQALPEDDNGQLLWNQFFPRQPVDSVDIEEITVLDERPTADRREWNARGRLIPMATPERRKVSIVPIESYDKIEEREMQRMAEVSAQTGAPVVQVYRNMVGVRIPQRVDRLAMADYRRLEVDCFQAWTAGTITQRNPQDASRTYTASFGFDAGRYQTAATAWNDPAVNAYDEFIAWYTDSEEESGAGAGVMLRRATRDAILADAPELAGGVRMTLSQLEERIRDDIGADFRFFLNERTVEIFDDGGIAKTRTKLWPVGRVGFIPADIRIGFAAFAPVKRAMDMVGQVGEAAGIDVRGVTVYYEAANLGRELNIEAQVNAMPVPAENRINVINAGV